MFWKQVLGLTVLAAGVAFAQGEGIAIDDALTIQKCGGCHRRDANGMMSRISYIRTSPEVWEQAIKRMVRLNGLAATPAEVREILRYLSNNNGLAPEEMKPGFWEVEHRVWGYQDDYVPNPVLQKTCNNCHNIGRVLAQRRTKADYEKLVEMHIGMFPSAQRTLRPDRRESNPALEAPARLTTADNGGANLEMPRAPGAPAAKDPADLAIEYLSTAQPLITPEWTAWKAAMRAPKLAGTWLLSAYQPGKGKIYGTVTIAPGAAEDQFATTTQFQYASGGPAVKATGRSIMYTGYSWRGRSASGALSTAPQITATPVPAEWREALMMSRDGNSLDGRWFWSGFGELGIDVHLTRMGAGPVVLGTDVSALKSPSSSEVTIFGAGLDAAMGVDLGPGVTVTRVVSAAPDKLTVAVDVAGGLPVGKRDLTVGSAVAVGALAIYDRMAYIEVIPEANISRLGGLKYPKEYAQFDVTAWAAGPDGIPNTADDVDLGPVSAQWSLEEFFSTPEDDDAQYVGTVDDSGFFTPNVEGPNPERKKQANNHGVNNFGDVWVAAAYTTPEGEQLKAKSYLVVTVPNYTLYDQPEVAQ